MENLEASRSGFGKSTSLSSPVHADGIDRWAWLRQDIWAAFRERRKILSYYTLTRACKDLDFWELVNRAVFLLGQCVNYASDGEVEAGRMNVMDRVQQAQGLLASLEEWRGYFKSYDRRLPAPRHAETPFVPIWVNPPAASKCKETQSASSIASMGPLADYIRCCRTGPSLLQTNTARAHACHQWPQGAFRASIKRTRIRQHNLRHRVMYE